MALPFTARREEGTPNMSTNNNNSSSSNTRDDYNPKPKRTDLSKLVKANRQLKRKVQKEFKRRETIERLQKENNDLSFHLLNLRDENIPLPRNSNFNEDR